MNSNLYDIIIIGAGVAGSTAAYELASAGFKVLVLEKEKLPRYKTCGGGVVRRVVKLLPFEIEQVAERKLHRADIYDHENELCFRVKREEPIVYMMMRDSFDLFILKRAVEKGTAVKDECEATNILVSGKEVTIQAGQDYFSSRFVIAADGATGISARSLGLNTDNGKIPALEYEVVVDDHTFSQHKDSARFDFGVVPYGYAWVFPKKNHLSIGVAALKKVGQPLRELMKEYFKIIEIREENIEGIEKHGYVIPINKERRNFYLNRILFAGDIMGLADPITAEGISYSIESGMLAAKAVIENNFDVSKTGEAYKQSLSLILKELKGAEFLSKFVYGPPSLRKFVFKHYGDRLSQLLTDVIMMEMKYSSLVNDPMNYLKLLKPAYIFRK
jgi:geranylgeranyl reductase family protein